MGDDVVRQKGRSVGVSEQTLAGWQDYVDGSSKRKDATLSSEIDIGDHYLSESKHGTLKIFAPFPNRLNVSVSILDMSLSTQELNKRLKRLWADLIPALLKFYEE